MTSHPTGLRRLLAFDHSDRRLLSLTLLVVPIVTVVVEVVVPVLAWVGGRPVEARYLGAPVSTPRLDAAGVTHGAADLTVRIADPTTSQRVLDLVPGVVVALLVAVGCRLLWGLVRAVASGDPFGPGGWQRLMRLAILVGLGATVAVSLRSSLDAQILAGLGNGVAPMEAEIVVPWMAVAGAAVLALFAEAFAAGSRLRDDVEGLV